MNKNIGRLIVSLGLDPKDLERALMQTQRRLNVFSNSIGDPMRNFGQSMKNMGWALRRIGIDITTYLITPLVTVGTMATNLYKNFEFSMQKINSLVGVAQGQIDAWNDSVLSMSTITGRGPKELADALYFITSAGLRGSEALAVLESSAKASAAGLGETKDIADLVTSAVNAYGSEVVSAAHATDVLIAAVKEGKAEAVDFSTTMGKVLPVASDMGVELHQVAGAMAAMTRTGSNAFEATTQLRQILFSIAKPAEQSKKALAQMKTSVEEVRDIFRNRGLLEGLMFLKDLTNEYGEDLMAQVFPNIRAFVGVIDLLGSNLEDTQEIMKRMTETTGLGNQAFQVASETLQVQLNNAINSVKIELIRLGGAIKDPLITLLKDLTSFVSRLGDNFAALSKEQQESKIRFIAHASVIGAMTTAISILLITLGNAILFIRRLTLAIAANPWALAAAGVAALTFLIIKLIGKIKEHNAQLTESEKITKEVTNQYSQQAGKIDSLIWIIENENMSNNKRIQAINELKSIMPEYNAELTKEGELINHNKKAIDEYIDSMYKRIELDVLKEDLSSKMVERVTKEHQLNDALYENVEAYREYQGILDKYNKKIKETTGSVQQMVEQAFKRQQEAFLKQNPKVAFIIDAQFDLQELDKAIEDAKKRLIAAGEKTGEETGQSISKGFSSSLEGAFALAMKQVEEQLGNIASKGPILKDLATRLQNLINQRDMATDIHTIKRMTLQIAELQYEIQKLTDAKEIKFNVISKNDPSVKELSSLWDSFGGEISTNVGFGPIFDEYYKHLANAEKNTESFVKNINDNLAEISIEASSEGLIGPIDDFVNHYRSVQDEIVSYQRDAIEQGIRNQFEGSRQELAILNQRKKWFLEDLQVRVDRGELAAHEMQMVYEAFAKSHEQQSEAIINTSERMETVNLEIASSLRNMAKYGSDSFREIINWISDALDALNDFIKYTQLAVAAQKALNKAKAAGGDTDSESQNLFNTILNSIGSIVSLIGIFVGVPMARGGVVPPGYPNDSYPALLTSGEVVVPAGKADGMMGGQVRFVIEDRMLVGILKKANKKFNNY